MGGGLLSTEEEEEEEEEVVVVVVLAHERPLNGHLWISSSTARQPTFPQSSVQYIIFPSTPFPYTLVGPMFSSLFRCVTDNFCHTYSTVIT